MINIYLKDPTTPAEPPTEPKPQPSPGPMDPPGFPPDIPPLAPPGTPPIVPEKPIIDPPPGSVPEPQIPTPVMFPEFYI